MKRLDQSGSHVLAICLLVVAIAFVGYAGYKVEQAHKPVATQTAATTTAKVPATVKTTADLNQAGQVLDQSATQLNTGLDDTSLDADLNSML